MDRERLEELKERIKRLDNYDLPHTGAFKNRVYILNLIDALLEDDKPKTATEVVMKEEVEKELREVSKQKINFTIIKYNWTPEELKAIKESIIHWRDNVSRLKLADKLGIEIVRGTIWEQWIDISTTKVIAYFNAGHCRLCMVYRHSDDCSNCPLFRSDNWCKPENSAWRKCVSAQGNKEIISSTENMVSVLESLLE